MLGRRDSVAVVTMKSLLESGVHFGHQVRRWDPRMKKYIFAERNGIHIIDLQKTVIAIREAYDAIRRIVAEGKSILFVGRSSKCLGIVGSDLFKACKRVSPNRELHLEPNLCFHSS